jgi:glycosyltransferase involved in cell wall biosynthesis
MKSKKKKILIITYYRHPCTEPMLENVFAKNIGERTDLFWLFLGDCSSGSILKWHNSTIMLSQLFDQNTISGKCINKLKDLTELYRLFKTIQQEKIDIVLLRDIPFFATAAGLLKRLFGVKVYYQCTGVSGALEIDYARFHTGIKRFYYNFTGVLRKFFDAMALRHADFVFPITEFHKNSLPVSIPREKIIPLTMGVDEDWLGRNPRPIPEFESMKGERQLITYFGTLNFLRDPIFLLKVFAKVKQQIGNCSLLLIGDTAEPWQKIELMKFCQEQEIERDVHMIGRVDRDTLQDYLQYSDISVSFIPPTDYFRISSPTKIYESLGNRVPVVGNRGILEQEKVLNDSQGGILCDYDEESACNAIVDLLSDEGRRKVMGARGRDYVIQKYSYGEIAHSLRAYFE